MQFGAGLRSIIIRDLARSRMEYGGFNAYCQSADIVPMESLDTGCNEFQIQDEERFQRFLAGDFERFTLAAIESFYRSRSAGTDLSFTAWRLLESYYAAFFAGHAIMRALGGGVSYLASSEASRIRQIADLYGLSDFDLAAGSVFFEILEQDGSWRLTIRSGTRGKGVHDGFWRDFCDFIQRRAEKSVAEGGSDATDLLAATVALTDRILVGGNGTASWLAETRNAINYRHELNAWFPYHKSLDVNFRERLLGPDAESVFRIDLSRARETLPLFENLNAKIVHILWDVAELFQSISKKSGHFGNRYSRMIALMV